MPPLVESDRHGLFCAAGGFHIDPWDGVERAVITHAHSDHGRFGSAQYLAAAPGAALLRERLGATSDIRGVAYGETLTLNGVQLSLHPAGHILGSAQVRIEHRGRIAVVSGDYKRVSSREEDPTCEPFEPLRCHEFISECTFGLPIYRWRPAAEVMAEIHAWWRENQARGRTSVMFAYPLGKSQRVLAGLDAAIGPIVVHGAAARYLPIYHAAGVRFPPVHRYVAAGRKPRRVLRELGDVDAGRDAAPGERAPISLAEIRGRAMIVAPPFATSSPWLRQFGELSTAFASGWMQIRGMKRRRNVDRGFVLSDHADWSGLLATIRETGAKWVGLTHGYTRSLAHFLRDQGVDAHALRTRYEGELEAETGEKEAEKNAAEDREGPAAADPRNAP